MDVKESGHGNRIDDYVSTQIWGDDLCDFQYSPAASL